MNQIRVEDAVGKVILHDITRIVKDEFKGVGFKKGHIIQPEDVEKLKDLGKFFIYAGDINPDDIHENDAALILGDICKGENLCTSDIKEGKIELVATKDGYLDIDIQRLNEINDIDDIIIATRIQGFGVKKGDKVAGARIIPLFIDNKPLKKAQKIFDNKPLINIKPFVCKNFAVITIGNEVYNKRIKDTFTPVVEDKLKAFECKMVFHQICSDDVRMIKSAIEKAKQDKSIDLIFCTGGMSVDPDDRTPAAIKLSGADIVNYGAPSLPGSMFLLGYFDDGRAIAGLPGCVMFAKNTIFDVVLPRLIAKVKIDKKFFKRLGYGGYCTSCPECHFPNCWYLKGY